MVKSTETEYKEIIKRSKKIFIDKTADYGTSWRILRLPSITDQIFIKAQRIRSIQEKGQQLVSDDINSEFMGIINYCVIALIQIQLKNNEAEDLPVNKVSELYDEVMNKNQELLHNKNHDYGEAWREMRVESITDIILIKLLRVKQIEDNKGQTRISEGIDASYMDIINYCVFALIKSGFTK